MYLKAEFVVKSDIHLDDFWDIEFEGVKFSFQVDSEHKINKLILDMNHKILPPSIVNVNGIRQINFPISIRIAKNKAIEIAKKLNYSLSLFPLVGFIDIKMNPTVRFIAENEKEKAELNLFSYHKDKEAIPPFFVPFDTLARMIFLSQDIDELRVPVGFYKSAKMHFKNEDFRFAFYELYFTIEYLFANGKSNNSQVKNEFLKSDILLKSINLAKDDFLTLHKEKSTKFSIWLSEISRSDEIIEKIIDIRGSYFHQSKKRKNNWLPSDLNLLKDESYFLIFCVGHVLERMINLFENRKYIQLYDENNKNFGIKKTFDIEAYVDTKNGIQPIRRKVSFPTKTFAKRSMALLAQNLIDDLKRFGRIESYVIYYKNEKIFDFNEMNKMMKENIFF